MNFHIRVEGNTDRKLNSAPSERKNFNQDNFITPSATATLKYYSFSVSRGKTIDSLCDKQTLFTRTYLASDVISRLFQDVSRIMN